jgi:hypothetical protein
MQAETDNPLSFSLKFPLRNSTALVKFRICPRQYPDTTDTTDTTDTADTRQPGKMRLELLQTK